MILKIETMFKKEVIWRELLYQAIEKRQFQTTQKELAQLFNFSLSTVFNALKVPRAVGAVEVSKRGISVRDIEKFISLWATVRNLKKDIVYQAQSGCSAYETERLMPNGIVWTAYSALRLKFPEKPLPASYDKVYVYALSPVLEEIKKRFPKNKQEPNVYVLKSDPWMKQYGDIATSAQILTDLWNMPEWYATEFYKMYMQEVLAQ